MTYMVSVYFLSLSIVIDDGSTVSYVLTYSKLGLDMILEFLDDSLVVD